MDSESFGPRKSLKEIVSGVEGRATNPRRLAALISDIEADPDLEEGS